MADEVRRGTSFLWKPPTDTTRHLRLVATDPDRSEVVVVPIETYRTGYDKRVVLTKKDHAWIDPGRNSIPAYAHIAVYTPDQLTKILAKKECRVLRDVVPAVLLDRILTAALSSPQTRPDVLTVLRSMAKPRRPAK
jgi:hypothetical protein